MAREGVGWGHLSTREDFPNYIKVLKEKGPASLALRRFMRVLYIGEVFVVSNDGDQMGGSLNVLFPFFQCKDYGKKFAIIDVIVAFSGDKCLGEIGAWMGVTIEIVLEEDGCSGKERSIGHDGERTSNIWDAKDRSGGKGIVKGIESFLLEWGPIPWLVFSSEKVEGSDHMQEIHKS